ncbi:Dynein light chain [Malassezia pachydermatis]|uniref:Dynein light chain n=1 Tax=Malassezia pachydermatis TaxID=77020 RepID=A0A0M8MSM6_9BASI|nr:dynein light chain [Malassezia pachydermatis]KOS13534.1 dynein light chain [Malassezia pachydermatis]
MSSAQASEEAKSAEVPKAVIKNVDMEPDMQQALIEVAADAMIRFAVEKDMAAHIKRTADERYGPTWHVIVGRSFGSFVTHESKHFLYFYLGPMAFLLWRA